MVEMRTARPGEEARQRELWRLAFGDEEPYIDAFYSNCYRPEDMVVLLEDGVIHTMAALVPMTLRLPDGTSRRAAYLYALATHPGARNKGYGRQLLNYADFFLKERGYHCVTITPAEASLHRLFASVGYDEGFATRKLERLRGAVCPTVEGDVISPVSAQDYTALRDECLKGAFYLAYDQNWIAHQKAVSRLTGADLYRLTVAGVAGVAAVEYYDEDSILVKELLIPPDQMEGAVALIKSIHPALRYHIRTPACWDGMAGSYGQSFSMIKWFREEDAVQWGRETQGYLGLALD